jgi:hypothetical protein
MFGRKLSEAISLQKSTLDSLEMRTIGLSLDFPQYPFNFSELPLLRHLQLGGDSAPVSSFEDLVLGPSLKYFDYELSLHQPDLTSWEAFCERSESYLSIKITDPKAQLYSSCRWDWKENVIYHMANSAASYGLCQIPKPLPKPLPSPAPLPPQGGGKLKRELLALGNHLKVGNSRRKKRKIV